MHRTPARFPSTTWYRPTNLSHATKTVGQPSNPILPQPKQGLRNLLLSLLLHRNPASSHSRWATYVRRHVGREKGGVKERTSHRSSSQNSIFVGCGRQTGRKYETRGWKGRYFETGGAGKGPAAFGWWGRDGGRENGRPFDLSFWECRPKGHRAWRWRPGSCR